MSRSSLREESGVFDMPSIIIGAVTVGVLTAGILAGIFGVLPWTQDKAAQQDLAAVMTAQENIRALTADEGPGRYLTHSELAEQGILGDAQQMSIKIAAQDEGACFTATSRSKTGKIFWVDSESRDVREYTSDDTSSCAKLSKLVGEPNQSNIMRTTWDTSLDRCDTIVIPAEGITDPNSTIDWGDGSGPTKLVEGASKAYGAVGLRTVEIVGSFDRWPAATSTECLTSVDEWGSGTKTTYLRSAFAGASHLTSVPEIPITATNLGNIFYGNYTFNADISDWDTSNVTDMSGMFGRNLMFNADISGWDTSKVTDMNSMFMNAETFSADISGWDTSNVTDMSGMFQSTNNFNADISGWDTSKVTDMGHMFYAATAFNVGIDGWDTSKVTNMAGMFNGASVFSKDLSRWKVEAVISAENFRIDSGITADQAPKSAAFG